MRTTLDIDDDVLHAARRERKTAGEVISELARTALTAAPPSRAVREPAPVHGFRPFGKRGGSSPTS